MNCPKCGESSSVGCRGKWNAVYPSGCLWFFGPVLAILHQAATAFDFRCDDCEHRFKKRTTTGRVALGVILFVLILYVARAVIEVIAAIQGS